MQRKLSSLTDIALHVGNPLALFVLAGRFVLNESMTIMLARCPEHLSKHLSKLREGRKGVGREGKVVGEDRRGCGLHGSYRMSVLVGPYLGGRSCGKGCLGEGISH